MKRLRTLTGLIAICGMSVFMTGCGDDDDGGGGGPTQNAPDSLAGTSYTLTSGAGDTALAFGAAGNSYTITEPGSATESGTWSGDRTGDTWNLALASDDGITTSALSVTFTSANSGQFTLTRPNGDSTSGNFTRTGGNPGDTGDADNGTVDNGDADNGTVDNGDADNGDADNGTVDNGDADNGTVDNGDADATGDADGGTTTDGSVAAPAAIARMDVTNTESGTGPSSYTIELSGGNSGTFMITAGSVGQGTFTYTPSGNNARLVLTYTDFPGDSDDMNLAFHGASGSSTPSSHSGTQVVSGTSYPINGTFTYVAQ